MVQASRRVSGGVLLGAGAAAARPVVAPAAAAVLASSVAHVVAAAALLLLSLVLLVGFTLLEPHELTPHARPRLRQPFAARVPHLLVKVALLALLQEAGDRLRASLRGGGRRADPRKVLLLVLHRALENAVKLGDKLGGGGAGPEGTRGGRGDSRGGRSRAHVLRVEHGVHAGGARRKRVHRRLAGGVDGLTHRRTLTHRGRLSHPGLAHRGRERERREGHPRRGSRGGCSRGVGWHAEER
mmetsp:Transcript_11810/g.54947  ORF Transcript_11810/g.54947 Transcript_11810/m.54947 type:complete len:241 (-) Transcript_11810:444-1166(-)